MAKSFFFGSILATLGVAACFHPARANLSCSSASHYGVGDGYHGRKTASGETFNAYGLSVAHRDYAFGTKLAVVNVANKKTVIVRVNDRGPYIDGRIVDLSYGAFSKIASPSEGVITVCIKKVS